MSIFNDIEQQLIDIDKSVIQKIWDNNCNDLNWVDDKWLEYPYCKSIYAVVEESGYKILVYAQRICDTYICNLEITDVNYNGKSLQYDFFPKNKKLDIYFGDDFVKLDIIKGAKTNTNKEILNKIKKYSQKHLNLNEI